MNRELLIDGHKLVALSLNQKEAHGQPVILIHGIGGSVNFWGDDQTQVFRDQGPCYSLSLPGHYPASFPNGFRKEQLTAEMLAQLLTKAIRELAGDQLVTLVGMSTGGFAALAIATYAPELVKRVICVSGFHRGKWIGGLGFFQQLARSGKIGHALFKSLYRRSNLTMKGFRQQWFIYAKDIKSMFAYLDKHAVIEVSYPYFMQLNLDSLIQYFEAMPHIDIQDWLPRIHAATLVIAGDCDPIVSPEQAEKIHQGITDAELVTIPGAGHVLFAERPEVYERALRDWLERNPIS